MKPIYIKNPLNSLKQIDLAAIFSVTDRTIRNWDAEGLPGNGAGRDRRYDLAVVLPWYVARISGSKAGGEPATDKARRENAEADIAEMDRDLKAGSLVNADESRQAEVEVFTRLRTNLMGFVPRLVDRLEMAATIREKYAVGQREMAATLRDLTEEIRARGGEV
jgi:phage terminase Nu1 subunit (DNA packaging protein)